jgi:hypothetical protein
MGDAVCFAVEVAFENTDYELAVVARVVKDDCQQKPVTTLEGSGVCAWHYQQIRERRRIQ